MEYNTVQKKALIAFLKENSARSYTIDEISNEIAVGKSTIYRLIPTLVSCGIVKKFNEEGKPGKPSCHTFLDDIVGAIAAAAATRVSQIISEENAKGEK